ncbi:hypothetical protein V8G54_014427 [Vigna mungo]|uniref:Uncharacterized protein n=1 Tax=Vigna mungo TaxID=3915 RepID=A0AAQ3NHN3_VIGMU
MMVGNEGNHAPEFRLTSLDRACTTRGSSTASGFFVFQVAKTRVARREVLVCLGGLYSGIDEVVLILSQSGENVGQTHDWRDLVAKKMKDDIPGTMFGAGNAFGPFHVLYEMR